MLLQDRRDRGPVGSGGTTTPPAPWTGSPMKAAIVSAPSRIVSSSSSTSLATNSSSLSPSPLRYGRAR